MLSISCYSFHRGNFIFNKYSSALKFLAPTFYFPRWMRHTQLFSTSNQFSEKNVKFSKESSNTLSPKKPLTQDVRNFLSSALRVNQAGELAATLIYKSQITPLATSHPHLRTLISQMYDQENGHFCTFNKLVVKHRVRPTAMYPLWTLAASVLGWTTGVMGREVAMACTEAVETEIGSHYNSQVRELLKIAVRIKDQGEDLGPELEDLIETIRRIRDEELEHLDHAVNNDAHQAVPHDILTSVIRLGCRQAIRISESF